MGRTPTSSTAPPASPTRPRTVEAPVRAWIVTALVLVVLQHVAARVLRPGGGYPWGSWLGLRQYLDGWVQYDGHDYLRIAADGYQYTPGQPSTVVWFPLYPLLIRAAQTVVPDGIIAGVLLSAVAGLGAALLYWKWLGGRAIEGRARVVAFATLMLYPYAWYLYGVVYADALFLFLVLGAFLAMEKHGYVLAGFAGILATATRPTGLALVVGLVVMALQQDGVVSVAPPTGEGRLRYRERCEFHRERLRARTLVPALSILGIVAYSVFLGIRFNDPFAWLANQAEYHSGGSVFLKRPFFAAWRDIATDPVKPFTVTAQWAFAIVVIACVPAVGRRFGWGYAAFVGVLVAIPVLGTADIMGAGRYMSAAFPVAALLGERLSERPRRAAAWLAFSGIAMLAMNMAFSRSWYLS